MVSSAEFHLSRSSVRTSPEGLATGVSILLVFLEMLAVGPSSGPANAVGIASSSPSYLLAVDGLGDWVNQNPSTNPLGRASFAMTYAEDDDRVVLFGGGVVVSAQAVTTPEDATWTYDLNTNTWVNRNPSPRPPPLGGHAMAYDMNSDRVVLFGGCSSCPPDPWVSNVDTWAYHAGANTWTDMAPDSGPPAMIGGRMAYDSQSDQTILFGGLSPSFSEYSATWAYHVETNTWTNMAPPIGPSARNYQGMAYDAKSDRIILFGGAGASGILGETWAYDFDANVWTNMQPATSPPPTDFVEMVYDSQSDRVILFGGNYGGTADSAETWAYNFGSNVWTKTNSPAPPPARSRHALAYDSESDRTVLFGGLDSSAFSLYSDTWSYDYLEPAGGPGPSNPILEFLASPGGLATIGIGVVVVVGAAWFTVRRRKVKPPQV